MKRSWARALPITLSLVAACGDSAGSPATTDTDDEASSSSGDIDPTTTSPTTTPTSTGMATTSATTGTATTSTDDTTDSDPDTTGDTTGEPGGCGNGEVEDAEQCDDGNEIDGDGCNIDCVISGSTIWELELDIDGLDDGARGLAIAADGRVVIVGETQETQDGAYDVLAVGIDALGTVSWQYRYDSVAAMESPGGATDRAYEVVVTEDGESYFSGNELFAVDADSSMEHVLVTKLDANGEEVWRHGGDDTMRGRGYALGLGPDDELFVVGTHGATAFVSKYNTNGLHFWTEDREGTGGCNGCDRLLGVRPTADGGAVVSGAIDNDDSDVYVAQFDAAGGETWTIVEEVAGDQSGGAASASGDGTLVVVDDEITASLRRYDAAGDLEWSLDGLAPDGSFLYDVVAHTDGGFVALSGGYVDQSALATIDRYDADGALLWTRELITPFAQGGHEMRALRVGADGRIGVVGMRGTVAGNSDVWVVVLAS